MHTDNWAAEAAIQTADGQRWALRYYVRVVSPPHEKPVYGITIEKYAENGLLAETNSTPGLTKSYAEATGWAERFARGQVTPCVLNELADEWTDEWADEGTEACADEGADEPADSCADERTGEWPERGLCLPASKQSAR